MTNFATELVFWIVLPGLVALGAAYLVWLLMQARIHVLTANYQTAVARAESDTTPSGPGLEQVLAELRMERRRYVRRVPGPKGCETTVITQERLFLRNIPLTSWMQEELQLGTGEEIAVESSPVPLLEPAPESARLPIAAA